MAKTLHNKNVTPLVVDASIQEEEATAFQKTPKSIVLENFEGAISNWHVSGAKYTGSIEQTSKHVRFGKSALKISYDFRNQTGISGIYVGVKPEIEIEGHPKKIGMWVYGDGQGLWLRGSLLDANGKTVNLNFTGEDPNGVTWKGWKYVEADVSTSHTYRAPFKLNFAVRYMSTQPSTKVASTIFIDQIRAVYEDDPNEDTTNPTFGSLSVTQETNKPTITLPVADNVALNTEHFLFKVNGEQVAATVNKKTNELTYTMDKSLADGLHTVWAKIFDEAGNCAFQTFEFNLSNGGPRLTLSNDKTPLAGATYNIQMQLQNANKATGIDVTFVFNLQLAEAMDKAQTVKELQLHVHESLQQFVTKNEVIDGQIYFALSNVPTYSWPKAPFATLQTKMSALATGTLQLQLLQGAITYDDEKVGTLPFQLSPFEATIEQPLKVEVIGKSVGTPSTIRVVDITGKPVEGATFKCIDAPVLIQTTKETTIYKGSGNKQGDAYATIPKNTFLFATNEPTENFSFYRVYMPDGQTRYFHVASSDVKKQNIHKLLSKTNANGEIYTSLLTLTKTAITYQVVKDQLVSAVNTLTVLPQLGSEKVENITLSFSEHTSTSMNIRWKTGTTLTETIVQYVEYSDEKLFNSTSVKEIASTFYLLSTASGELNTHKVELTNLKPGTTYAYRVGLPKGYWTEPSTFTTPTNDASFHFLFATDTQASNTNDFKIWTKLVQNARRTFKKPHFIIHGGDIIDDGDNFAQWQAFLDASPFTVSLPLMAVMGNHETYGTGENTFKQFFHYTSYSPVGYEGLVYRFDYKNARFIMLNTELGIESLQKQTTWLQKQIESAGDKWTIVVMHRSPYSSNPLGGGSDAVAAAFTPIIEAAKVDLVLTGHDHSYMRTKPIFAGKTVEEGQGTTYIIGGSAGPKFYPREMNGYAAHLYDKDQQVISNIAIDGNVLNVTALNINGEVIDEVTLQKRERSKSFTPMPS